MMKAVKTCMFLLVIIGMVGVIPACSQEKPAATEQQAIISVPGEVVSVDAVKSSLVFKQVKDPVAGLYENITLTITPDVKIVKGEVAMKLSDLKAGDKIIVNSMKDMTGKTVIKSISVEAMPVK